MAVIVVTEIMQTDKKLHTDLPEGHYRAEAVLIFLTLLWGTSFTYTKIGLEELGPLSLTGARFLLATIMFFIFYFHRLGEMKLKEAKGGILLGVILFIGYTTQTFGLQYTTASRSAFITAMAVCIVPFLVFFIRKRIPQRRAVVGVAIAVVGLIFLTNPFNGSLNKGDLLTFFCSIAWALYIVLIEEVTLKQSFHVVFLWQLLVMTVLNLIFAGVTGESFSIPSMKVGMAVIYLAIVCTFLTTALHTKFQKGTTATRAALIFSAEPVVASFFAAIVISEHLSKMEWIGGLIIIAGIIYTETGNNH